MTGQWRVDDTARHVVQAPKLEPRIMRYELSDYEWDAVKPMTPPIFTAHATWSNGSSTRSSTAVGSQRAAIS